MKKKKQITHNLFTYGLAVSVICPFVINNLVYSADLLEVYNKAVRSDPTSISAHLNVLESKSLQQQSEALLYPQASLSGSFSENHLTGKEVDTQDYSGTAIKLNINQVLFDMQAWRDNEKQQLLVEKSSSDYLQAQNELMLKVVELYFAVLETQDALALTQKNSRTIGKNVQQLKALYQRQLISITGVYEAEARHDAALTAEIEASTDLSVAFERLYEVIAERVSEISPLKKTLQFLPPDDDVEQWLKQALEHSPIIAAAESSVLAAKKELSVKRAGFAPRFSLGFTQSHQDTGYDNAPRPKTDTSTIALNFSQPIYQGGGISAQKMQSVYRLGLAEQAKIQVSRKIEQQVREFYLNLKSSVLKIKSSKRRIKSEKKRAESMKAGFSYGTVTVNDVLNAETDYLRAQMEYQKAKYSYIVNEIKLKSISGLISEKDIMELNGWVD